MKFLLRALGTLLLAVGVVFAVGDIARSIADEATRLLSIKEALQFWSPFDAPPPQVGAASTLGDLMAAIGQWPMSLTAGCLGLALIVLGRKRRQTRVYARR